MLLLASLLACYAHTLYVNKVFTTFKVFFFADVGYNKESILGGVPQMNFIIVMTVFALFITAMLTSSYNEDKTKGL
jgi:hypothetical protein